MAFQYKPMFHASLYALGHENLLQTNQPKGGSMKLTRKEIKTALLKWNIEVMEG